MENDAALTIQDTSSLTQIGWIANEYVAQNTFKDYQERIAPNTVRRQRDDLTLFAAYLAEAGLVIRVDDLLNTPDAWEGITHGIVEGFVRWMLREGYAIGSINVRLATVKSYIKRATKAGVISSAEYALMKLVEGDN